MMASLTITYSRSDKLVALVGKSVFDSYIQRIVAGIAAVPIEYKIAPVFIGKEVLFSNYADAEKFLKKEHCSTDLESTILLHRYGVVFSDGNLFERDNLTSCDALELHESVGQVAQYFQKYHANKGLEATR
jgi:hypothetical protein